MTDNDIQSQELEQLVDQTAQRIQINSLITGASLLIIGAIGWLVLAACVDMLFPLPVVLRVVMFALFWVIAVAVAALAVAWPLLRPITLQQVAHRIEAVVPNMHNRLVTVLDLRRRREQTHVNEQFARRLIDQTRQRLSDYRVEMVADPRPVRRSAIGAGAVFLVALVLMLAMHERMPNALARVLQPTADIPPESWVKLRAYPGDLQVLQGDKAVLEGLIERGSVAGLQLRLRPEGGSWISYPMLRSEREDRYYFEIAQVETSFDYQIVGGGTWTRPTRLEMIRRPILEKRSIQIRLPDYMNLPEPRPVDEHATQISAPVGSTIEIAAGVSQDAVRGQVQLLREHAQVVDKTVEQEIVWFDDEPPADAALEGRWSWTALQVHSGTRSHTFGWARESYGFKTRLSPLNIEQGQSLFVWAWLDPIDRPKQLRLTLHFENKAAQLVWGEEPANQKATADSPPTVHCGPLPPPGHWQRLTAPLGSDAAMQKTLQLKLPAKATGITFEVDGGKLYLDRTGALRLVTESVRVARYEKLRELPMTQREDGQWVGGIPVEKDGLFTLAFFNQLDIPSADLKPVPLVATSDQPPSLLIEKPGKSLTLANPEPVPLVVRAFDDYGVAQVGLQFAATAEELTEEAPTKWLGKYAEPKTSRLVMAAIDPAEMQLQAGASMHYRLVARDRFNQVTVSEAFRLGLAAPEQASAPEVQRPAAPLNTLLESIGKLVNIQSDISAGAVKVLSDLPGKPVQAVSLPGGAIKLTDSQGRPVTAERIRELLAEHRDQLSEVQIQQISQLETKFVERAAVAAMLTQEFDAAATAAELSPLSLPMESQALKMLARKSAVVLDLEVSQPFQRDAAAAADADVMDRLASLQQITPAQQAELEQLRLQVQQMQAARQMLQTQPELANQQMNQVVTGLQAQQSMQNINQLGQYMQTQQQELDQLRMQVQQLQAATQNAPAADLAQISQQQQELDQQAIPELQAAQQLVADPGQMNQLPPPPPAPWQPPGEVVEGMPTEKDTPPTPEELNRELSKTMTPEEVAAQMEAEKKRKEEEALRWWDKPVDAPPDSLTREMNPRLDRDDRPVDPLSPEAMGSNPQQPVTPRQALMQHQDAMHQQLTQNSLELAQASQQVQGLQQQMEQALQQLQQAQSAQLEAQAAGQTEQAQQAQAQLQAAQAQAQQIADQLRQAMNSQQMQQAMMMAQRAQRLADQQRNPQQSQGGDSAQKESVGPGQLILVDLDQIELGAQHGVTVYRLPPGFRNPLIQGMKERGPEAYQPLIDAYYRRLSEEAQ